MEPKRDSHGRFKAGHPARTATVAALGIAGAVAAGAAAALKLGWLDAWFTPREGDAAPDLAPDAPPPGTDRAPPAFRPDPGGAVDAADREALRPPPGFPVR